MTINYDTSVMQTRHQSLSRCARRERLRQMLAARHHADCCTCCLAAKSNSLTPVRNKGLLCERELMRLPRPKPKGGSIQLRTPSKIPLTAASTAKKVTICSGSVLRRADGSKDDRGGSTSCICLGVRLARSLRAVLAYDSTMRLTVIVPNGLGHDNSQSCSERWVLAIRTTSCGTKASRIRCMLSMRNGV